MTSKSDKMTDKLEVSWGRKGEQLRMKSRDLRTHKKREKKKNRQETRCLFYN